jgi:hypothetical protein
MDIDRNVPTKLNTIHEAPEPISRTLADHFPSQKCVRLLIYAPAATVGDAKSPATVLAVTDEGWLMASENDDGSVSVDKCSFSDTLFLQLTSIVLWGELKIDYASVSTSYSALMRFSTVGEGLYREAIDLVLSGIDGGPVPMMKEDRNVEAVFEAWPRHFQMEARRYWPGGQRLLAAVQWPAILGGFRRELAPAAALLVTERELALMTDEKAPSWDEGGEVAKFGGIITYFPLVRLADHHVSHQERFSVLALAVNTGHGGERLELLFPSDHEKEVLKTLEQARRPGAIV